MNNHKIGLAGVLSILAFAPSACGVHNAPAPVVTPTATTSSTVDLDDNVPTGHGVEVTFGDFEDSARIYQRWTDPPATLIVPPRSTALR